MSELNFSKILDELNKIAEADGVITNEERKFLKHFKKDVAAYEKALNEAHQNDYISSDEFHELIITRDRILTNAVDFNFETEDVEKLVQRLFDLVNAHPIPGMEENEYNEEELDEKRKGLQYPVYNKKRPGNNSVNNNSDKN